ncbi:hypothetical protein HPP92_011101 [Vanilla planifolia]|uniref:Uncharacterized protein n=1 Tax=Vanilla planifolia TaxID=51239 RepID=A0A835RAT2_VANPL|nr:hypothetical protein HPP92_011366 [Vanilla planifolia]KAG0483017.1 hypothetical protein HPP92_011101 [Vanilla planifolia]
MVVAIFLMGETNIWVELEKIFSLGDDLIGVLNCKKDGDNLMEFLEDAKALRSFCEAHALENKVSLEEHRKKVNECKEKMEKLKSEGIAVSKLDDLQTELGNKMELEHLLREDLR